MDIGLTDVEETRLKIRLTAAYDAADRSFYSSKYLRYIVSLLGCASVGPKYLCCDHSFNLRSLRIHIVTPTDVIVGFLFLFFPFCVLYSGLVISPVLVLRRTRNEKTPWTIISAHHICTRLYSLDILGLFYVFLYVLYYFQFFLY